MGNTQVTSFHPVQVGASFYTPKIVKNISGATVYYAANPGVSSTVKDGELLGSESVEITNATWFVTAEKTDTEISVSDGQAPLSTTVPVNLPGRREIESVNAAFLESSAVGVYATIQTAAEFTKATALKFTTGVNALNVFYYDPKLYEVGKRLPELTLEMLLMTDNVAPTASFIAGLYKLEKVEGAEKNTKSPSKL